MKSKLNICYICGPIGDIFVLWRFGAYDSASTLDIRYKAVKYFENKDKIKLHFKSGYDFENFGTGLEKSIPEKGGIFYSSKAKLSNIMKKMDAFILEFPSTTLCEVIATKAPILLLTDSRAIKLRASCETLLEKRVFISRTPDHFLQDINELCQEGSSSQFFKKPRVSNEFYEQFLTGPQGNSVDRTSSFLNDLLV